MATATLLAGDIGGTKSNIAEFKYHPASRRLDLVRSTRYPSNDYPSLNAILRMFLQGNSGHIAAACFGVPGVVHDGRVKPTNIGWAVDAAEISSEFEIPYVQLLNDLEANAYGIGELDKGDLAIIQSGNPEIEGNRCVVSPGTGLGEAGLFWDGKQHRVWACEGGHTDFAPRNELQFAMLQYLSRQFNGHVSYERVVSGHGLENIYKFLRDTNRGEELPEVAAQMQELDAGAVISQHALAGTCPMCAQAMEIFVDCLGAEAGNFALKAMAVGGVYLGGGIPAKILPKLKGAGFAHAFTDKGRLSSVLEAIPVRVILNDQAALLGAARYVASLLD